MPLCTLTYILLAQDAPQTLKILIMIGLLLFTPGIVRCDDVAYLCSHRCVSRSQIENPQGIGIFVNLCSTQNPSSSQDPWTRNDLVN